MIAVVGKGSQSQRCDFLKDKNIHRSETRPTFLELPRLKVELYVWEKVAIVVGKAQEITAENDSTGRIIKCVE